MLPSQNLSHLSGYQAIPPLSHGAAYANPAIDPGPSPQHLLAVEQQQAVPHRTFHHSAQAINLRSQIASSERSKELVFAEKALRATRRAFYNKQKEHLKSSNKISLRKDLGYEIVRIAEANRQLHYQTAVPVGNPEFSRRVMATKAINCDGLSEMAANWLLTDDDKSFAVSALVFSERHSVTLLGTLPAQYHAMNMEDWPDDVAICDPWANIACRAKDYPAKFAEKMAKWKSAEKLIHFDKRWLVADDPIWLGVLDGEKNFYPYRDG